MMSRFAVPVVFLHLLAACNEPLESDPPRVTELAFVGFDAKQNRASSALWQYADAQITLRVVAKKVRNNYKAEVFAAIPGVKDTHIFTCENIHAQAGHLDFMLRGNYMHILCINPPVRHDKGSINGARFRFDPDRLALTKSGTYGGDGTFDIDSIELDEGTVGSESGH